MTITERAAYVKGLAEGLGIDDSTKEGKIINALIAALDDMALTVYDLEEQLEELTQQLETVSEDLENLEDDFYDDEEGSHHHCGCHDDEDDDEYLDDDIYEVCCPTCGDVVCIDSGMLAEGQTTCPNCGELLEFDLEEEEGNEENEETSGEGKED